MIGGPSTRPRCPAQVAAIRSGTGGPCSWAKFCVWDDLVNDAQLASDRYVEIITAAALVDTQTIEGDVVFLTYERIRDA